MKTIAALLAGGLLALAGCGDDSEPSPPASEDRPATQAPTTQAPTTQDPAAGKDDADGTSVEVRKSDFGPMLFDSNGQAIYIFQNDPTGKTVCYGDCAEAWPPVFTDGEPKAGEGVRDSLLGTVKRRDGKRQVTYAGKPLYFYAHEGPGQVLCHNVHLNGGLWWVVGPDGKRRPA
jgi:predicted lipoprotein with Yx(FWY)xxD motif